MPADNVWKCPRGTCDFSSTSKPLVDAHCKEAKGRLLYICAGCRYTQCDASFEIFQSHLRNCAAGQEQLVPFSVEDRFRVRARMMWAVGDDLRAGSLRAVQFPVRSLRYPPWQAIRMPREGDRTASHAGQRRSLPQDRIQKSQRKTTGRTRRRNPDSQGGRLGGIRQTATSAQSRPQGAPPLTSIGGNEFIDLTGDGDEDQENPEQAKSEVLSRQDSEAVVPAVKQYKFVYEHPELDDLKFTYEEDIEESVLGVDYPGEIVFDYSISQTDPAVEQGTQDGGGDEAIDWKAFGESIFGTGNGSMDESGGERKGGLDVDESRVNHVEGRLVSRSSFPVGSEADAPGETESEYEAWFEGDKGE